MKRSKNKIILTVLISILLFVSGLFVSGGIYDMLLPKIDNSSFQITEIGDPFRISVFFSFVLGLTPIFIWTTWLLTPIVVKSKRFLCAVIIIICMALAIFIRQQAIRSNLSRLTTNISSTKDQLNVSYPIDKVHFEYYMLGGLFIGCIISYFLFRQKSYN